MKKNKKKRISYILNKSIQKQKDTNHGIKGEMEFNGYEALRKEINALYLKTIGI